MVEEEGGEGDEEVFVERGKEKGVYIYMIVMNMFTDRRVFDEYVSVMLGSVLFAAERRIDSRNGKAQLPDSSCISSPVSLFLVASSYPQVHRCPSQMTPSSYAVSIASHCHYQPLSSITSSHPAISSYIYISK